MVPGADIHCFEPQEECWEQLEISSSRYSPDEVVINKYAARNIALDQATFYSHDSSMGVSGFHKINLQSQDSVHLNRLLESEPQSLDEYKRSSNHERHVKIVRLDEYMKRCGVSRVNLLKIDTQGYEPEVLDGLGERLSDVDVVITELMFYDYYERSLTFSDIEKVLLPTGFHLYDISHIAKNPMNGRTDWVTVIYVNHLVITGGQNA